MKLVSTTSACKRAPKSHSFNWVSPQVWNESPKIQPSPPQCSPPLVLVLKLNFDISDDTAPFPFPITSSSVKPPLLRCKNKRTYWMECLCICSLFYSIYFLDQLLFCGMKWLSRNEPQLVTQSYWEITVQLTTTRIATVSKRTNYVFDAGVTCIIFFYI
jgi:hypothetical protein